MNSCPDTKTLAQNRWLEILPKLGVDASLLDGKHHPYPEIGCNEDGFRFIDKQGDGYCCLGHGKFTDGFGLLKAAFGWDFKKAAGEIDTVMGWSDAAYKAPTKEELAKIQAQHAIEAKKREDKLADAHIVAAKQCLAIWKGASIADDSHPYLKAKGVHAHGLRLHTSRLVIPVRINHKITSLQYIDASGNKIFATGSKTGGGAYLIAGKGAYVVCEGYATGASIFEATGLNVLVVFNARNLIKVAKTIRKALLNADIIIAADNDQKTDVNTGLNAAVDAAQEIGGVIALSVGKEGSSVDWNDIHAASGLEVVAAGIANAVTPEILKNNQDNSSEQAHQWHIPESLFTPELKAPEFTRECMPILMWEVASNAAHVAATTTVFSVPTVIGDVIKSLSGMVDVALKDGDISNLVTLFMANIAGTGEGKSATQDCLSSELIREYIEDRLVKEQASLETWADELDILRDSKKKLMKKEGGKQKAHHILQQLNLDIKEHERSKPKGLCVTLQSPTPEALIERAGQYGYVMLSTDEGSQVLDSFGRYSDSASADVNPYLKGYDGGEISSERRNNEKYGGLLRLGMNISIQPVVAMRVLGDSLMAGRGLLNRMTWLVSPSTAGNLDYRVKRKRDNGLMERWEQMLLNLIKGVEDSSERIEINLSSEAEILWMNYANSLQAEIKDEKLEGLQDLFHKRFPSLVLRVAAIFHCVEYGLAGSINIGTTRMAIEFCEVVKAHRLVLHQGFSNDNNRVKARSVLRKLAGAGYAKISISDLHRKHWIEIKDLSEAKRVLEYLNDTGWSRLQTHLQGTGRPKSPVYDLHPEYQNLIKPNVRKVPKVPKVPKVC